MSDLLPLVATVLKDKATLDAQAEIAELRKELEIRNSIEIIKFDDWEDIVAVYASGQLKNGKFSTRYDNTNMFQVDLEKKSNVICGVADLNNCKICAGGGFRIVDILLDEVYGWSEWDECNNNMLVTIEFDGDRAMLNFAVNGLSKRQYETRIKRRQSTNNIYLLLHKLVSEFPNATLQFQDVSFSFNSIKGPLKRFLSPKERKEIIKEWEEIEAAEQERLAEEYEAMEEQQREEELLREEMDAAERERMQEQQRLEDLMREEMEAAEQERLAEDCRAMEERQRRTEALICEEIEAEEQERLAEEYETMEEQQRLEDLMRVEMEAAEQEKLAEEYEAMEEQ